MLAVETRTWRRLVVPLAVVGVVGLAGCGQGSTAATSPTTSAAPSASAAPNASAAASPRAYRTCLADNGVTLPRRGAGGAPPSGAAAPPSATPGSGNARGQGLRSDVPPPGVNAATWAAARKACADLVPSRPARPGQGAGT